MPPTLNLYIRLLSENTTVQKIIKGTYSCEEESGKRNYNRATHGYITVHVNRIINRQGNSLLVTSNWASDYFKITNAASKLNNFFFFWTARFIKAKGRRPLPQSTTKQGLQKPTPGKPNKHSKGNKAKTPKTPPQIIVEKTQKQKHRKMTTMVQRYPKNSPNTSKQSWTTLA